MEFSNLLIPEEPWLNFDFAPLTSTLLSKRASTSFSNGFDFAQ